MSRATSCCSSSTATPAISAGPPAFLFFGFSPFYASAMRWTSIVTYARFYGALLLALLLLLVTEGAREIGRAHV